MGGHRRSSRRQQGTWTEAAATAPGPRGARPQGLRPDLQAVMHAIDTLYKDQLKPFGRILRKRIAEHASGAAIGHLYVAPGGASVPLPEVDVTHLRAVCEACGELRLQPEEGGDWSAVVQGQPEAFVDVYSLEDPYPAELWARAEAYFKSLGSDMALPGGRYACAQALSSRHLDFLAECSLGQVCHIVQLAITQRKVLGYCNGAVVPYSASQSMMKEHCAENQQPTASSDAAAMPLASWEVTRTYIREILQSVPVPDQGPAMVPLSNIKRLFRSRYHTELSETMLGHSRLSDLIQDEHLQDICSLELQKSGYVVVQKLPPTGTRISLAESLLPPASEAVISLAERLRLSEPESDSDSPSDEQRAKPLPFCVDEPLLFEDLGQGAEVSTPLPSPGVPASATVKHWLGEPHRLAFLPEEPLSAEESPQGEPRRVAFCPDEPLCLEDAAPTAPLSVSTPLPSPGEPPSATVRRWTGLNDFFAGELSCSGATRQPARPEPPTPLTLSTPLPSPGVPPSATARRWSDAPRQIEFCPDEPLCLEELCPGVYEAPTPLASPGVPGSATVRRWAGEPHRLEFFPEQLAVKEDAATVSSPGSTSSPSSARRFSQDSESSGHGAEPPPQPTLLTSQTSFSFALAALSGAGEFVHNTFIHAKLPPPTPLLSRRRAHSAVATPAEHPAVAAAPSALQRMLAGLEPLQDDALLSPKAAVRHSPQAAQAVAATPRWLAVSPLDSCVRLTVRNTFLHSTPAAGARAARRSRSTPPDASLCTGTAEALGQALQVLPRLLSGIESTCDIALTPGSCKSAGADALPAFVPLSPALTASPTDCGHGWLTAPRPLVGPAQRVVRLADHV